MNPKPSINEPRLRELFRDMVDIYSPSGKEDEIVSWIGSYLKKQGIERTFQTVEKGRRNIIVTDDNDAELLFLGHIDTVPAPDFDHYGYSEEEDIIYGLGTADMKGGCAAMIEAFTAYREQQGGEFPAVLALVVGEEETGDGALAFLEDYHAPWAIVGEPTRLKPCFSHYGYLEFMVSAAGRRIHASQASLNDNAVFTMLNTLLRLADHCVSGRNDVIFNIRDLMSSNAGFAAPDHCEVWLDLHVPSQFPIEDLIFEVEDIIRTTPSSPAGNGIDISCNTIHRGYSLPEKGPIAEILREVYSERKMPWETDTFLSDSDAVHLWQSGIRPVILGPGGLEMAHTYDECVSFSEVRDAAEIYLSILMKLTGKSGTTTP